MPVNYERLIFCALLFVGLCVCWGWAIVVAAVYWMWDLDMEG